MLAKLIAVLTVLVGAIAATEVKKCSGDKPFPLDVRVIGCDVPPCIIIKGTTAEFYIDFVSNRHSSTMKTLVRATTLGMTVPYELPDDVSDVCSNLEYGAYCPLYPTEDVTYKFLFPISHIYPEISVKIEISIVNQDADIITCFLCDIKVRKGETETLTNIEDNYLIKSNNQLQ